MTLHRWQRRRVKVTAYRSFQIGDLVRDWDDTLWTVTGLSDFWRVPRWERNPDSGYRIVALRGASRREVRRYQNRALPRLLDYYEET